MTQPANGLTEYVTTGVALFGEEAMKDAAEMVLSASFVQVPSEYNPLLNPQTLQETMNQLDDAMTEIAQAGYIKEQAYTGMGDLKGAVKTAAAAVGLKEAEAFMLVKGDGKDAYAIVDGEKMMVTNDKSRDALRKHHAKAEHEAYAEAQTRVDIKQANIDEKSVTYERAVELSKLVQSKALLQAHLLGFLSKG